MKDKIISAFKNDLVDIFNKIEETEAEKIDAAAQVVSDAMKEERMVHVIGPGGHSNMAVEEVLWRAGGLAAWNPILDAGTNLIHGAKRSNIIERTPGYAKSVMDAYRVGFKPNEVIIIVNAYGINPMTIDTCEEAKRRGMTTIAVTSSGFAKVVPLGHPARHPSGKNLYEEADIFINNYLPVGDSVIEVEGFGQKVGSTSTFCNCFVMNCLVGKIVEKLVAQGIKPPVFMSANMPGGDENNRALEEKYFPLIKHLM